MELAQNVLFLHMHKINFSKVCGTFAFVVLGMTTPTKLLFIPRTLGWIMFIIYGIPAWILIFYCKIFPVLREIFWIYEFFSLLLLNETQEFF